ncbi:MAG: HAD-IIB family hydrolase, partial [Bacteroidales bacterium]|nr:HAD-IIB family hydrolase [Bacteroidales bacterium]
KIDMKIVFTDLDGTLLNNQNRISDIDLLTLDLLKQKHIITVVATGRNLFSTKKVLTNNLPFDYLIYSTGVAITNFKTKELIKSYRFSINNTIAIVDFLVSQKLNFFMHFPVPKNHNFLYNYIKEDTDFKERFEIYSDFSAPLTNSNKKISASQFVIVLPYDLNKYNFLVDKLNKSFSCISIIRATSPLNNKHIWLEIYPKKVNKGYAAQKLCNVLGVSNNEIIAIGNDYNDEAMLEIAGKAFVVDNSPDYLKQKFSVVNSNNNNGFSDAVLKSGILDI